MADDLESTIESVATQPKKVVSDGQVVENHDLTQIIEADKHLAGKNAMASSVGLGIKLMKLKPPGTVV